MAANVNCKYIDFPANGECIDGWTFMPNEYSTRPVDDPTVVIDCLGTRNFVTVISSNYLS